jgi:hypothetical protein
MIDPVRAEHYRTRAKHYEDMAETAPDVFTRKALGIVARRYERFAEQAEEAAVNPD